MFLLLKLKSLFDSLKALSAKFPDVRFDLSDLFSDIETAVLNKSWTLAAFTQVVSDAEKLITDFATEWTGSAAELSAFVAAFKALFA